MALTAVSSANQDDITLCGRLMNLFQQAQRYKQPRIAVWDRNYRMLYNRAWGAGRPDWMPAPALSNIYAIGDAWVAWMTDRHPEFNLVPFADATTNTSEFWDQTTADLSQVLDACWTNYKWDSQIEIGLWDEYLYGTMILKALWDPTLDGALGNPTMRRVDPYAFYPDPQATSLEDGNYYFEVRNISLQELDRRFPGAADRANEYTEMRLAIRTDPYNSTSGPARANPAALPGGTNLFGQPGQAGESVYADRGVTLYECWIREHEVEKADDPNEPDKIHDYWRIVCFTGNCVLMDEKAEALFGHGRHPYSRSVCQDIGDFWGMSICEHLVPLQNSVNRLLAALQMNAELCGNPVLKEDSRSGVVRSKMVNRPGQRFQTNPGATFEWMKPPEMPQYFGELIKFYLSEMERVSGLSAMNRGMTPQGRNSSDVLDAVQEAGFVRVRSALRNLERCLQEQGSLITSLICENYTEPRMVSTIGDSGQQTMTNIRGRHFYTIGDDDESVPLRFNILVDVGSSLPTSRPARANEADRLFGMGALDTKAVLDAHRWPGRHEIYQRILQQQIAGIEGPNARQRKAAAK